MRKYPPGLHTIFSHGVLVFSIALLTGCGSKTEKVVDESLGLRCVILSVSDSDANGWQQWFKQHLKGAKRFSASEAQGAANHCLGSDSILILPDGDRISNDSKEVINQFLQKGGRVLMCGLQADDYAHADMPVYAFTSGTLRVKSTSERIEEPVPAGK